MILSPGMARSFHPSSIAGHDDVTRWRLPRGAQIIHRRHVRARPAERPAGADTGEDGIARGTRWELIEVENGLSITTLDVREIKPSARFRHLVHAGEHLQIRIDGLKPGGEFIFQGDKVMLLRRHNAIGD